MNNERMRILQMLESEKIDVEEAEKLLDSLDDNMKNNSPRKVETRNKAKFIKIIVEEEGEEKVNISIPVALASSLLKFIPKSAKESLEENDIRVKEIIRAIEDLEGPSTLVDINDKNEHVKIKLE